MSRPVYLSPDEHTTKFTQHRRRTFVLPAVATPRTHKRELAIAYHSLATMAAAAAKAEAAASQPRAPMPMRADVVRGLLLGLPPDARAEDIEYVLDDVQRTLSRLASKRKTLQDQIAAASRGKRRTPRRAPPPAAPVPTAGEC